MSKTFPANASHFRYESIALNPAQALTELPARDINRARVPHRTADAQSLREGFQSTRIAPVATGTMAHRTTNRASRRTSDDVWISVVSALDQVSVARILYAAVLKRALDVAVATILLLLLSPLFLFVLLLVRLDSDGPAIYRQQRVGHNAQVFRIFKFRTMTNDPSDEVIWIVDEFGRSRHKLRHDPRVTTVGRWLRRTSVDELPQLINVLRGEMSLIGPRPELPQIVEGYAQWQHARHLVRPGLTGWWQVSGRSDLPMHEHTELDVFYVRRQSFRLDMQIAVKTVRVVFKGEGAF